MWWLALTAWGVDLERCAHSARCPVLDAQTVSTAPLAPHRLDVEVFGAGAAVAAVAGGWVSLGADVPPQAGTLATSADGALVAAWPGGLSTFDGTWRPGPAPWPGGAEVQSLQPLDHGWAALGSVQRGVHYGSFAGWTGPDGTWIEAEHPGHEFAYSPGGAAPWWVRIQPTDTQVELQLMHGTTPGPRVRITPGDRVLRVLGPDLLIRSEQHIQRGDVTLDVGPEHAPQPTLGARWKGVTTPSYTTATAADGDTAWVAALQHTGDYEAAEVVIDPCQPYATLDCYMVAKHKELQWTGAARTELVLWRVTPDTLAECLRVEVERTDELRIAARENTVAIALHHMDPRPPEAAMIEPPGQGRLTLARVDTSTCGS